MSRLLIVETQTPMASIRLTGLELAWEASEAKQDVTLWLMQDAVHCLQLKDAHDILRKCCESDRITIFADSFALAQRGVSTANWPDIQSADIHLFTEHLLSGDIKPLWH